MDALEGVMNSRQKAYYRQGTGENTGVSPSLLLSRRYARAILRRS
jgi:hypothetical protein